MGDQIVLEIEKLQAWQPSKNVSLHNLNLVSLKIEIVNFFAEIPAVVINEIYFVI